MQWLWGSTLAGIALLAAAVVVIGPMGAVLLGTGIFLLSGGVVGLLIRPFTRPGAVTSDDHGDGHGHGGHGGGHH